MANKDRLTVVYEEYTLEDEEGNKIKEKYIVDKIDRSTVYSNEARSIRSFST